jgi:hypothetical protein
MITLSAKITGLIVTTSMALFMTAVAILCVIPLIQAIVERRRPQMPNLSAVLENLGVAIAIAGFAFRTTDTAAVGVGLILIGAVYGYRQKKAKNAEDEDNKHDLHPLLHKVILVCGVLSVGALGEYYYLVS